MKKSHDNESDLTFFAWADTHFGYDQRFNTEDLRYNIIDQINNLAGWPYPESIGGNVSNPDFILHCGDILDGEKSADIEMAYYRYFMSRLRVPSYEVLGNHDTAPEFMKHFLAEYKSKSYSFDKKGIHFISLNSVYDEKEAGHVEKDDLDFLKRDIDQAGSDVPIILCVHSRLDRLGNGDDVLKILKDGRVILIISAHIHKPSVFTLDGINCIDIGHCRSHPIDPEYGRSFYVVRISGNSLTAIPWRWDFKDWERGQRWQDGESTVKRFILSTTF